MSFDMFCVWVEERIDDCLDGSLCVDDRKRLERHAESCPSCAESLRLARVVRDALHAMPVLHCPPAVQSRVEERLHDGAPTPAADSADEWNPSFAEGGRTGGSPPTKGGVKPVLYTGFARFWRKPALVAMAGLIITVGALGVWERTRPPEFSDEEIARARRQARVAFAYIGRTSRSTGKTVGGEVVKRRIVAPVRDAVQESKREVIPTIERAVLNALFVETRSHRTVSNQEGDRK